MPRKRTAAEAAAAPKPPRVRKKKQETEPKLEVPVYEPLMQSSAMIMDDGMFTHTQDYGYAYGSQPTTYSTESAQSPFLVPQSSTPQPPMMMRPMGQNVPQGATMPAPQPPPPTSVPMAGPSPTLLEFRLHEMNRRLYTFCNSGIPEKDHCQWWDAFSHEFFDDAAQMFITLTDDSGQGTEKFVIGRQTIPRFFRSFIDSGVKEMYFVLQGGSREAHSPTGCISFENDNVLQVTKFDHPMPYEVRAECKLMLEFTSYDELLNYRIRTWGIELRNAQEYFINEITKEPQIMVERSDIIRDRMTRCGLPVQTKECLTMCRFLEPMQALMSTSKMISPQADHREVFRRTLFNYQATRMNSAPMMSQTPVEEPKTKPPRKRTRKPAAKKSTAKNNVSPAPSNPSFPQAAMPTGFNQMGYQDVLVVGEPSMMGGEFGDEDERTISRVENAQYDPNALQMQQAMSAMSANMMPVPGGIPSGGPPIGHMPPPNGMQGHGGMPNGPGGLPPGSHPGQMPLVPPQSGLPPPYSYGQTQPGWSAQQSTTTMITG